MGGMEIPAPTKRREDGTTRDGGKDDSGARAEWEARLADQERMAEMFQYMQSFGASHGFAPPPLFFPLVDPAQFHTPMSIKILVLHDIY
jgi:hypothetical protein